MRRFLSTSSLPPTIRQLLSARVQKQGGPPVQVNGWVKSVRLQKNIAFAVISDGTSDRGLQAVFKDVDLAKRLANGVSVRLCGRLSDSPGRGQDKELQVDSVEVLGECDQAVRHDHLPNMLADRFLGSWKTYPIQKQALSVEYLRDNCHLRARTDTVAGMLRLRDTTSRVLHHFFETQGFCHVHTPLLTSNDCEGAGETFKVVAASEPSASLPSITTPTEFFGRPAFLTVSSQLHLEALAAAISRVYTLSPCFRAERSQTNRHLSEFWMLEAEWAFTNTIDDVCNVVEAALKGVLNQTRDATEYLWRNNDRSRGSTAEHIEHAASALLWNRLSYTEAVTELAKYQQSTRKFRFEPAWGNPLQSEHERWIAEELIRGPVFVTNYPASLKPFYMRLNDDEKTVACFDLLIPTIGELVGGSLREERYHLLKTALDRHNLDKEDFEWYLDLRRYGGAPHGGFGLGFERLISWLSGIENIRECIAMPRWTGKMLL
ncbi:hypothetical protein AcW1_003957 [Taiwanofungus camphoratus]|nr:hypothetical protein AcW2_007035 [Antrodia cinnamomea]KAI0958993.1 hypothetical protein AcW1_003957 [Antrodia cinnamomea]